MDQGQAVELRALGAGERSARSEQQTEVERSSQVPEVQELPELPELPPDGGWLAWRSVLCASTIAFWYGGTTYSWGVLQAALVDNKLAPASTLAFVGSLAVAFLSLLAMVNARMLRSVGSRRMGIAGVLLMGFGQILAGFSTHSVAGLFVTAGVMMGIGVSFSFMVASIVPTQYFAQKRGTAVGLVYAGAGLGGASISLAMEATVRKLGTGWTFRLLGIVLMVCCLPAAWFLTERTTIQPKPFIELSLFRSYEFLLLFASGVFVTFPLLVPPFFLPLYAQSLHLPTSTGAILVCVFNFCSAGGRILMGYLSDKLLGPLNALLLSLTITALTLLLLWPTSTSLPELTAFVILNGASNGAFFAIMPNVVGTLLGNARLAVAFGMIVTGWTGGYLMGAPIAGYILNAYGGEDGGIAAFRPAVFWAGGMAAGAAGFVFALRLLKSRQVFVRM